MIVCLDSGNTRIKWGVHDGATWLGQGATGHDECASLAELTRDWPMPQKVLLANVAGDAAAAAIRQSLAPWSAVFSEVRTGRRAGGVTNLYQHPERLGVDRWCALVGARSLVRTPVVVVMAGTATTIDTLDADGNFLGGFILPGSDLMLRSLARDTAGLPFATGHYSALPRCTDDAIVSGAIEAQAGAIERAFERLGNVNGLCILSGGNAEGISRHLVVPCRLAQNLPLEGLKTLAFDH